MPLNCSDSKYPVGEHNGINVVFAESDSENDDRNLADTNARFSCLDTCSKITFAVRESCEPVPKGVSLLRG
jgi:hypothetical protein